MDEVTWQAAQKQLQKNKDTAKRNIRRDYLLNGLVTCARCGRGMVISHSGCKQLTSYYACLSQRSSSYVYSGQVPCKARQVPTKLLDEYVFDYLLELCSNPDKVTEYIESIPTNTDMNKQRTALAQMIKAEKELTDQKDTVLRWFRQRMLTENEVEVQLKEIRSQLVDIASMKKVYETEIAAMSASTRSHAEIAATIKNHLHKDNFTATEKRIALQAILDRVIVERVDDTRGRGSRPALHVQLKLK